MNKTQKTDSDNKVTVSQTTKETPETNKTLKNNTMKNITIKSASNKVDSFLKKRQQLNIDVIFTEDHSTMGICSKSEMEEYISKLDSDELFNFKYFLDNISDKARVIVSTKSYTDRFGTEYVYVNINYVNGGGEKFKVICFPGFEKFKTALKTCGVSVRFEEIIDRLGINLNYEEDEKTA